VAFVIMIGVDVQVGPNVQLLTPTHPLEPEARRAKWEAAEPITVADNVWLGGGVIVCPGVSIGENTVVGVGAVGIKDLPANVVTVGNPAPAERRNMAGDAAMAWKNHFSREDPVGDHSNGRVALEDGQP
jgi:acetyltransferase-like isoleucine patch superfamily enzyme